MRIVLVQDIEYLTRAFGPGAVIEGQRDHLVATRIGRVCRESRIDGLLDDRGDALARDLARTHGLRTVHTGRVQMHRSLVVRIGRRLHRARGKWQTGGRLLVFLRDISAIVYGYDGVPHDARMRVIRRVPVDGGGKRIASSPLRNAPIDGDQVTGSRDGMAVIDEGLQRRVCRHAHGRAVYGDIDDGRKEDEPRGHGQGNEHERDDDEKALAATLLERGGVSAR